VICYVFEMAPSGIVYEELLEFCCSVASAMTLAVRDRSPKIEETLERLRPALLREERVHAWPGTTLLFGGEATLYWYRVTSALRQMLSDVSTDLYQWVNFMPEDPCFFRPDGQVVLTTVAHECDAFLMITEEEYILIQEKFPRLALLLRRE
jgi:hypothetical protein